MKKQFKHRTISIICGLAAMLICVPLGLRGEDVSSLQQEIAEHTSAPHADGPLLYGLELPNRHEATGFYRLITEFRVSHLNSEQETCTWEFPYPDVYDYDWDAYFKSIEKGGYSDPFEFVKRTRIDSSQLEGIEHLDLQVMDGFTELYSTNVVDYCGELEPEIECCVECEIECPVAYGYGGGGGGGYGFGGYGGGGGGGGVGGFGDSFSEVEDIIEPPDVVIPEPATYLTLGGMLLFITCARRRQEKTQKG